MACYLKPLAVLCPLVLLCLPGHARSEQGEGPTPDGAIHYWAEAVADAADAGEATAPSAEPSKAPSATATEDRSARRVRPFSEMIENIVIITRKRKESLQDIPV